jgi:Mg/Co/Ni transporter MgtE
MRPDPPMIMQEVSPEKAKALLTELNVDHILVVDEEKRLLGYVNHEALQKDVDEVGKVTRSTDSFMLASSSLKDGLSEIFTHDLGYLIVVDDGNQVLGVVDTEDIREILRR